MNPGPLGSGPVPPRVLRKKMLRTTTMGSDPRKWVLVLHVWWSSPHEWVPDRHMCHPDSRQGSPNLHFSTRSWPHSPLRQGSATAMWLVSARHKPLAGSKLARPHWTRVVEARALLCTRHEHAFDRQCRLEWTHRSLPKRAVLCQRRAHGPHNKLCFIKASSGISTSHAWTAPIITNHSTGQCALCSADLRRQLGSITITPVDVNIASPYTHQHNWLHSATNSHWHAAQSHAWLEDPHDIRGRRSPFVVVFKVPCCTLFNTRSLDPPVGTQSLCTCLPWAIKGKAHMIWTQANLSSNSQSHRHHQQYNSQVE